MVNPSRFVAAVGRYGALAVVLCITAAPIAWMIRVAFMPPGASTGISDLFTAEFALEAFTSVISSESIGRAFFNSTLIGLLVTIANVLFCFSVGYALARRNTLPVRFVFWSVVGVLMIPAYITIIPLYVLMVESGLYDSYWALTLPWLVSPIGIFLVRQYLESIPTSMEEAARVDGASDWRIMFTVVMPLCKPALSVLAIQAFFTNWNSFLFPFILTSREELRTLPVALALLQGHQAIDWQRLMAGSTIAVLPVLILFLFLQRHIVEGITAGAVKQ
jgi:multiple sugar transport system permease protein